MEKDMNKYIDIIFRIKRDAVKFHNLSLNSDDEFLKGIAFGYMHVFDLMKSLCSDFDLDINRLGLHSYSETDFLSNKKLIESEKENHDLDICGDTLRLYVGDLIKIIMLDYIPDAFIRLQEYQKQSEIEYGIGVYSCYKQIVLCYQNEIF